jgi:hypothetical protein
MGDSNKTRSMSIRSSNVPRSVIASGNAPGGSNGMERVHESGQMIRLQKMQKDLDETLARVNRLKLETQSPAPQAPKMDTGSSLIAPAAVIDTGPRSGGVTKGERKSKPRARKTPTKKEPKGKYSYDDKDGTIMRELVLNLEQIIRDAPTKDLIEALRSFVDAPFDEIEFELHDELEDAENKLAEATGHIQQAMAALKMGSKTVSELITDDIFKQVANGTWDGGDAFVQGGKDYSEINDYVYYTREIERIRIRAEENQVEKINARLEYNSNWEENVWDQTGDPVIPYGSMRLPDQVMNYIMHVAPEENSYTRFEMLFEAAGGEEALYKMCLDLENENENDYTRHGGANQLYTEHLMIEEGSRALMVQQQSLLTSADPNVEPEDMERAVREYAKEATDINHASAKLDKKKTEIVELLKARNNKIHFYKDKFAMVMSWELKDVEKKYRAAMTTRKRAKTRSLSTELSQAEYKKELEALNKARELRRLGVDPWLGSIYPSFFYDSSYS